MIHITPKDLEPIVIKFILIDGLCSFLFIIFLILIAALMPTLTTISGTLFFFNYFCTIILSVFIYKRLKERFMMRDIFNMVRQKNIETLKKMFEGPSK